jgi:ABC-2 type transporter
MASFRSNPAQFLTFFGIVLLLHYVAVNLATVCVAVSRDFLRASLIANLSFILQSLGGGFFVNAQNIAAWLRWTKWTAYAVSTLPQLISCSLTEFPVLRICSSLRQ